MILTLLLGCQQIDLSDEWYLDRLRLLAIQAEPAEPRPGDTVVFTSLAHIPGESAWSSIWFGCVDGDPDGCSIDPSLLEGLEDPESLTPEEQAELFAALQAAGLIGVEPGFSPTWVVPDDALAGLTEEETLEGVSATIQVTLTTEADTELVIRRMPISLATTPNQNPAVAAFTVDGAATESGGTVTVSGGAEVELEATALELESYEYVTTGGVAETRTEELQWRWYATGGSLGGGFGPPTGDGEDAPETSSQTWIAPEEAGTHTLHAVVLDGRGGMGWFTVSVVVE